MQAIYSFTTYKTTLSVQFPVFLNDLTKKYMAFSVKMIRIYTYDIELKTDRWLGIIFP